MFGYVQNLISSIAPTIDLTTDLSLFFSTGADYAYAPVHFDPSDVFGDSVGSKIQCIFTCPALCPDPHDPSKNVHDRSRLHCHGNEMCKYLFYSAETQECT